MLRLKVRGDGKNPTRKDYLIGIVDDLIKSGKWTDEINDQLLLKRASDWHVKKHIGKGKENEEEEELPALEQQVVFTTEFDPDKVLNDGNINYRGLMFQLHVRDLLTPETIELLNKIPTDQKKKQYLVSLIEGLKENDEWNADFNSEKLSRKIKEIRKIRQQVKSKVVEPTAGSSSSSSGGIGSAIASGAKAVGGAVLEAGKEAVKEAVVAGASRSAVMSLI